MSVQDLPEFVAVETGAAGVRIPPDVTVPLTPRVRRLLDTAELRRLARISQLGLVALVYPGAVHTRLEHSLGAYRLGLAFLRRLVRDPRFTATVTAEDAAAFVAAALLHDVGHWPYCHPLEDLGLPELPRHESLVPEIVSRGGLAEVLVQDWKLEPQRVASLIAGTATDPAAGILESLLSGPIDVDKMDYLARDSLHAGVPYGRHFDQDRLLASLCLDAAGRSLAITDKGRTAAELMVFARYVMFSEVYWHHAVRAATAMLQRAIWEVRPRIEPARLVRFDDAAFHDWLTAAALGTAAEPLVAGLFGPTRRLLKRAATFDAVRHPDIHAALAGRTYPETVAVSGRVANALTRRLGRRVDPRLFLIDAPPAAREVEFRIDVRGETRSGGAAADWRPLADVSPVVRSLAHRQFDELVKRVRVFAEPETAAAIAACADLDDVVRDALADHGTGQP